MSSSSSSSSDRDSSGSVSDSDSGVENLDDELNIEVSETDVFSDTEVEKQKKKEAKRREAEERKAERKAELEREKRERYQLSHYLDDEPIDSAERAWWYQLEDDSFHPVSSMLGALWHWLSAIVYKIPWQYVPPGPWKLVKGDRKVYYRHFFRSFLNSREGNGMRTYKYSVLSFLPKFFFEQYQLVSNNYFTIVMIVNFIPGVSPIIPVTSVVPLVFVLLVAAIKELLEDTARHISDYRNNRRTFMRVSRRGISEIPSKQIRVGHIIKVSNGQEIPADMVLLSSTGEEGSCYVTTANLDGETNLKLHKAIPETAEMGANEKALRHFRAKLECNQPNKDLDFFNGRLTLQEVDEEGHQVERVYSLDRKQLLLRGSQLRNTEAVYAAVVYAGRKTKLYLNMAKPPSKRSQMDKQLNVYVIILLLAQQLVCFLLAGLSIDWENTYRDDSWYLEENEFTPGVYFWRNYLTYFVLFNIFVPISLWVTLSVTRALQAKFIGWDKQMRSADGTKGPIARTSNLNEELGRIEYIFSDKTGTLTANKMVFRHASIQQEVFGAWDGLHFSWLGDAAPRAETRAEKALRALHLGKLQRLWELSAGTRERATDVVKKIKAAAVAAAKKEGKEEEEEKEEKGAAAAAAAEGDVAGRGHFFIPGVPPGDEVGEVGDIGAALLPLGEAARHGDARMHFLRVLSLCHACVAEIDEGSGEMVYRTPSPDEKALCDAARANGMVFYQRTATHLKVREFGRRRSYELLASMEFTSTRKRMSVVVRHPDSGEIWVLTKGADNIIYDRLVDLDLETADLDLKVAAPEGVEQQQQQKQQQQQQVEEEKALREQTREHIRLFAATGLRTLAVAQRRLSEEEFDAWKIQWDKAISTVEGREQAVERVAALVERDLHLVGCTAIEDKLQDKVPESIYYLRRAGIQIWVLTGDMQETAKYIAYSSRLFDADMRVLELNASTSAECGRLMFHFIKEYCPEDSMHAVGSRSVRQRLSRVPLRGLLLRCMPWGLLSTCSGPRSEMDDVGLREPLQGSGGTAAAEGKLALVVDGKTLEFCLNDHLEKFRWLGRACKSVVCCRVSPLQKARVVEAVREGEGATSLAVGDGANDVTMIQKAHVGVGIVGKEGTQAARTADYAIHEFKQLRRLIAVHGRYANLRSSGLIQYSFYKNITFTLPFLYFSFLNGFTGQTLYDSWTITFFNLFFTALPPGLYGIYAQDMTPRAIDMFPEVYQDVQKGGFFNLRTFMLWMLSAAWHSLVCYFVPYLMTYGRGGNLSDGTVAGLWSYGTITSFLIIIIVNLRMAVEVMVWNWLWVLIVFGTILFDFGWNILWSFIFSSSVYGTYYILLNLMVTWNFWLTFFLCIVLCLLPDVAIKYAWQFYHVPNWVAANRIYKMQREREKVRITVEKEFARRYQRRAQGKPVSAPEYVAEAQKDSFALLNWFAGGVRKVIGFIASGEKGDGEEDAVEVEMVPVSQDSSYLSDSDEEIN